MSIVVEQSQPNQAPAATSQGCPLSTMVATADEDYRRLVIRLFCGEDIPREEILGILIPAGRSVNECYAAVEYLRKCLKPAENLKQQAEFSQQAASIYGQIIEGQKRVDAMKTQYVAAVSELQHLQCRHQEVSGQSLYFHQRFIHESHELKVDSEAVKSFRASWDAAQAAEGDEARQAAQQALADQALQILASRPGRA